MKILKFILLLTVPQVVHSTLPQNSPSTIFVQYDCVNGSEQEPLVYRNEKGELVLLTLTQAQQHSANGTAIICAAEYEITTGDIQCPLKIIDGKIKFNPDFPGGATAAEKHRVLSVLFCDAE